MDLKTIYFAGPLKNTNVFSNHSQITHIVGNANYSLVYFTDGNKINISVNLKKIENSSFLPNFFQRVHKSYIVNPHFIKKISEDGHRIYLKNGVVIPVKNYVFTALLANKNKVLHSIGI